MKILIIGATGTIGKHVTAALQKNHEVVKAGSKSTDMQVDISSTESIENFYKRVGKFDALICAAGDAQFGPLAFMKDADFRIGVNSKLMGQVNLVLIGQQPAEHVDRPASALPDTDGIRVSARRRRHHERAPRRPEHDPHQRRSRRRTGRACAQPAAGSAVTWLHQTTRHTHRPGRQAGSLP